MSAPWDATPKPPWDAPTPSAGGVVSAGITPISDFDPMRYSNPMDRMKRFPRENPTLQSRGPRLLPMMSRRPFQEFTEPITEPIEKAIKGGARELAERGMGPLEDIASLEKGTGAGYAARLLYRTPANLLAIPHGMATQIPDRLINAEDPIEAGLEEGRGMVDWAAGVPGQLLNTLTLGNRPENPLVAALADVRGETMDEYYDNILDEMDEDAGAGMLMGVVPGVKAGMKLRPKRLEVRGRYPESNLIPETRVESARPLPDVKQPVLMEPSRGPRVRLGEGVPEAGKGTAANPTTAVRLLDGTIVADPLAKIHADMKVDFSQVESGGFVIDGKYRTSSSHAKPKAERERARVRIREKRAARLTKQASPVPAAPQKVTITNTRKLPGNTIEYDLSNQGLIRQNKATGEFQVFGARETSPGIIERQSVGKVKSLREAMKLGSREMKFTARALKAPKKAGRKKQPITPASKLPTDAQIALSERRAGIDEAAYIDKQLQKSSKPREVGVVWDDSKGMSLENKQKIQRRVKPKQQAVVVKRITDDVLKTNGQFKLYEHIDGRVLIQEARRGKITKQLFVDPDGKIIDIPGGAKLNAKDWWNRMSGFKLGEAMKERQAKAREFVKTYKAPRIDRPEPPTVKTAPRPAPKKAKPQAKPAPVRVPKKPVKKAPTPRLPGAKGPSGGFASAPMRMDTPEFKKRMVVELDAAIAKAKKRPAALAKEIDIRKPVSPRGSVLASDPSSYHSRLYPEMRKKAGVDEVTIRTPSGTFKIENTKEALSAVRQRVKNLSVVGRAIRKPDRIGDRFSRGAQPAKSLKEALAEGSVTFTPTGGKPIKGKKAITAAVAALATGAAYGLSKLSEDEQEKTIEAGVGLAGLLAFSRSRKIRKAAAKKAKATQTPFQRFEEFQQATLMNPTGVTGKIGKVVPGVATRATRSGNVVPSVRMSGTFVPKDFMDYHKAQKEAGKPDINFKERFASVDPSRVIEEMDGALRVSEAAKLPDQAGPTVRYVDWRRKELTAMKMDWTGEAEAKAKAAIKGLSKKERELAAKALRQIGPMDVRLDIAHLRKRLKHRGVDAPAKVVAAAQAARSDVFETIFEHANTARRNRFQVEIPRKGPRDGKPFYVPEKVRRVGMIGAIRNRVMRGSELKKMESGPGLPDFVQLNKNFNPHELKNLGLLPESRMEMDLGHLMEGYINTMSKDIFDTQIIQNNKAFAQQLRAEGYPGKAQYIERWTQEAFAGQPAWIDNVTPLGSDHPAWKGIRATAKGIRKSLVNSVFPGNLRWALSTQPSSIAYTVLKTGPVNTIRGVTDFLFKKELRDKITDLYSYKVKAGGSTAAVQDIGPRPASRATVIRRKREAFNSFLSLVVNYNEKALTGSSIAAGLRHGKQLGLRGRALKEYASNVGARTQSMYNLEDRPGVLRSELVKTGASFQTFTFEGMSNMREYFGKTGTPPEKGMKRIGQMASFLGTAMAINAGTNAAFGNEPWSYKSFLPFYEQLIGPIYNEFAGTPYKTTRSVPTAIGVGADFGRASRDVYAKDDWKKMRSWGIKYLPGFWGVGGGTQADRIVKAIEDVARREAITTNGKTKFEITSSTDAARAYMFGTYGTSGGAEYIRGLKQDVNPLSVNWWDNVVFDDEDAGVFTKAKKRKKPTTSKSAKKRPR